MAQQQTSPLRILLLAGGGIALLGVVFFYVIQPWREKERQLKALEDQIEGKWEEIQKIGEDRKKFQEYAFRSLPKQKALAKAGYDRYLQGILARNNIDPATTTIQPSPQAKNITIRTNTNSREQTIVYTSYSYQIQIRETEYKNVVKLLTDFDRTPILHRIESVRLQPTDKKGGDASNVSVKLEVEALVLDPDGPNAKKGVFAIYHTVMAGVGLGFVPWGVLDTKRLAPKTDRDYTDVARLNIFYGGTEAPPTVPKKETRPPTSTEPTQPKRDYSEFLKFVKLEKIDNLTDGKTLHAGFRNWNVDLKTVSLKEKDRFAFKSPTGDVMLSGTILRVEDRDVVFTTEGNMYRIHNGSNLHQAMSESLGAAAIEGSEMENEFFRMSLFGLPGS
ncbi:MAG: hypothetical protein ACFCD0_08330 [Gemmataceae bacterium]